MNTQIDKMPIVFDTLDLGCSQEESVKRLKESCKKNGFRFRVGKKRKDGTIKMVIWREEK